MRHALCLSAAGLECLGAAATVQSTFSALLRPTVASGFSFAGLTKTCCDFNPKVSHFFDVGGPRFALYDAAALQAPA